MIDELTRRGEFEKAGGDETIRKALEETPSAANAKYYAQIVKQRADQPGVDRGREPDPPRRLLEQLHGRRTELLQSAERRIFAIAEDQASGETIEIKDVIVEAMDRITARAEDRHAVTGVATGYYDLDAISPAASTAPSSSSWPPDRAWEKRRSP